MIVSYPHLKLFISGDLNCCLLKRDTEPAKRCLLEFLSDNSLVQCVMSSTYFTGSLLDVFITNCPDIVKSCFAKLCHFSTHKVVRAAISMPRCRPPQTVIISRCLKRTDFTLLNYDLAYADWDAVFSAPSVTDKWSSFLATFLPVLNAHAPVRAVKIRNPSALFVSDATKDLMCRRRVGAGAVRARLK